MPEADSLLGVFQYFSPVLLSKPSAGILTDAYAPHSVVRLQVAVVKNIKGNHYIFHVHAHFHAVCHFITEYIIELRS